MVRKAVHAAGGSARDRAAAPTVSIVVINFNYAKFVGLAIESALAQSLPEVEVIVVDDGSTDGSREVIDGFGDRIEKIFKANGGMSSALNAGFERTRGETVIFLDADDVLLPGAAATAERELRRPGVLMVHWPLWVIDAQGTRTGALKPPWPLVEGDLRNIMVRRGPVATAQAPTSGNAYARGFLERVVPLPEHVFRNGAEGFLHRLAPIYGLIAKVEEPQSCYRVHQSNDIAGQGTLFRLNRMLLSYPLLSQVLAAHLERQGVVPDLEAWMGTGSQYAWLVDAIDFHREVTRVIPAGGRFILIDGGSFGPALFPDHQVVPFLERGGEYWGPPSDDDEALGELVRSSEAGASHVVVAFTAFWWLDAYPGLFRKLGTLGTCTSGDRSVIIYDQSRSSSATPAPSSSAPRRLAAGD